MRDTNADRAPGRGHLGRAGKPISFRGATDLGAGRQGRHSAEPSGQVRTSGLIVMLGTLLSSACWRLESQTLAATQL